MILHFLVAGGVWCDEAIQMACHQVLQQCVKACEKRTKTEKR